MPVSFCNTSVVAALYDLCWLDALVRGAYCCCAQEIAASRSLQATTAASVVSIAFFNFFGVSVTKRLSGAARCTIDACRTLFIWCAGAGCCAYTLSRVPS